MPPQPVTQPSTPSMDNDVINLAKAIRQTESGGNFNAKGGSGESGAYQWMPDTWKAHAKQALGNENADMSPSNQNAVAYTVLKSWKDQGLNPAQIAAKWNSGSEVGWENKRGINSAGVQYDVPKYVKSVTDAYQTVKQGGQAFADPNNPSSTAAPQPEGDGIFKSMAKAIVSPVATMLARPFQAGAELLGASAETVNKYTKGNFGDWVAPVPQNFGDVKKDVGRAAQTVALGMGPVSGGAAFGAGMSLEQGNDLMSTETAINTGLGIAGGKLLDLVGKPLLNGAGKAIGVITPAIIKDVAARGAQSVEKFMAQHSILPESVGGAVNKGAQVAEDVANAPFKAASNVVKKPFTSTPEEVIAGREKTLFEIEQKYSGMRKNALYSKDGGASSRKRIADTDVLVGAADENGLIRTRTPGGAYDQYKAQYVEPGESVVMDLLEKEARSIDLAVVERNLIRAVRESKLAGKDYLKALNDVKKEIEGYRLKANKDGRIDLAELHRQKIGTTAQINWNTPPVKSAYRKAVAKGLKRTIEKESRYNIREANEELGKYYEDLDFLESLDGKIVNRGKMGKYFAQIAGNIAGGVAGGMSGGMAGSAIGTIVGGELASRIQGIMLSRSLGGAAGKGASRSAILEKAVAESKAPRLALPAPKPGALRSEVGSGKPINLPEKTQTTRDAAERSSENIKTFEEGYQSKGKIKIEGIDSEGNIQIIDNGNPILIPADELPVIDFGKVGKAPKSDLPTIDYSKAPEGPKVSASLKDQRSRKGTQKSQKIASPIKKPSTISDRVQDSEKKATVLGSKTPQTKTEVEELGLTLEGIHTKIYTKLENIFDKQMRGGIIDDEGKFIASSKKEALDEALEGLDRLKEKYPTEFEIARRWNAEEFFSEGSKKVTYDELPTNIKIYRGTQTKYTPTNEPQNFTSDKEVAQKFAGKDGVVNEFTIDKKDLPFIHDNWYLSERELILENPKAVLKTVESNKSLPKASEGLDKLPKTVSNKTKEINQTIYHGTSPKNASSIKRGGFKAGGSKFGSGTWFSLDSKDAYGFQGELIEVPFKGKILKLKTQDKQDAAWEMYYSTHDILKAKGYTEAEIEKALPGDNIDEAMNKAANVLSENGYSGIQWKKDLLIWDSPSLIKGPKLDLISKNKKN